VSLVVKHPAGRSPERQYIFDVIIGEYLGLDYVSEIEDREDVSLSAAGSGTEVCMPDIFFKTPREDWLRPQSLAAMIVRDQEVPDELRTCLGANIDTIPVIYGAAKGVTLMNSPDARRINLDIDIFGSAFFMLSRYEEACLSDRDSHGRFPAASAVAVKAGIIERPVVDEYVEILWACLTKLNPGLVRKSREYRAMLSHDVDRLFDTRGLSMPAVLRNAMGDITRRRDVGLALRRVRSGLLSGPDDYSREPCNTFEFIMDCSEHFGFRSAFYFIASQNGGGRNGDYTVDLPWVMHLIGQIHGRGHEIGLHASYDSMEQPDLIAEELALLRAVAAGVDARQDQWGGRQHYLRWAVPATWQAWNDAGLVYDSTLGFPEVPGFRCGTCFEYPVFNLQSRQKLELRERPLIVMETSLFSSCYMGLSGRRALEKIVQLSDVCRRFGGQFTMLWHNDNLVTRHQKALYREVVDAIS
jgi:hypothetical protein